MMKESAIHAYEVWKEILSNTYSLDQKTAIEEIMWGLKRYIHDCDLKSRIINQKMVFITSDYSRPNGKGY